ncbi:MAG: chromosome segregation protein SMC [Syntrophus sp. (in: bacteria)]|nr:chromosome segregation protein SMC [Syntrophus sp. (in: bacteria)]
MYFFFTSMLFSVKFRSKFYNSESAAPMKLKRLEITGFKTFREKVVLDFSDGITGVVGPNGCGKSNIVDALRWVMGEQRVKSLRGKKMEDVIFNGAQGTEAVGMAEVSMILRASGGGFPGIYAQCSEVMVSRKIFREGESEYALNGIPCRLLDIREFFMGTGVGARTYSLVEQNSVATLVEAKPEERRQFIEEAAGISKYKSRKEAAVRRMDQTQQNLVRVHDITREVKSQLGAVSRQARRAEQYKALKQEVRETELTIALQVYADLLREKQTGGHALRAVQDRETAMRTQMEAVEASVHSLKAQALETEAKLSRAQESLYQTRNAISIKEQGIEHATRTITELTARKQKDLSEIEQMRAKQQEAGRELQELKTLTVRLQTRIDQLRQTVTQQRRALEERKLRQQSLYRNLDETKIQYVDIASEKAKLKNMIVGFQKGIEDLKRRDERDRRELAEHSNRQSELNRLLAKIGRERRLSEETFASLTEHAALAADEQVQARQSLQDIDEEISAVKEDIGRKSSRLSSLKEFQESYEGCQDGVKSLMAPEPEAVTGGLSRDIFCGLVADQMEVPRQYETAVEAVLGEKLQYIIVKRQEDGLKAIDYLKNYSLGRGSFVPLEVRQHESGDDPAHYDHLAGALRLIDQVRVSGDFKGIADYLLGDVLLIPSLPKGISLWKQNGFRGTFVTPEGDLISPQGVLTGGNGKGGDTGLLRNRREISELQAELGELNTSLQKELESRKIASARIVEWEEEARRLRTDRHRIELEMAGKTKDLERFEDELKRLEQRIGVLDFNREQAKIEENDAVQRMQGVRQELAACEDREKDINEQMKDLQAQWDALRTDLEKTSISLTEEQVLLGSLEEKREAALQTQQRLDQDQHHRAVEMETRVRDVQAGEDQIRALTQSTLVDKEALGSLYREYEQLDAALLQIKASQQTQDDSVRQQEARIGKLKKDCDQAAGEIHELEMSHREISVKMENLCLNIQSKYQVDLEPIANEYSGIDEAQSELLKAKLDRDRRSLEQFGEVNLLALSEYEELKQRFDFLTAQAADLHHSLETLQKTIARINAVTRERFAETFAAVNACFCEVFTKLFPGGRGELRLTDDADMLETGVDIDIQVPGKRAQSISLLSGGEKSLAAIALIFAIILYRPTPFLILDEVDAALDDANILLFNRLIKDISAESQIVMITHNKRTMEAAGHLFGVTMQNHGISNIVSVSLS